MISETNLGKIDGFKENHQKFIKPPPTKWWIRWSTWIQVWVKNQPLQIHLPHIKIDGLIRVFFRNDRLMKFMTLSLYEYPKEEQTKLLIQERQKR